MVQKGLNFIYVTHPYVVTQRLCRPLTLRTLDILTHALLTKWHVFEEQLNIIRLDYPVTVEVIPISRTQIMAILTCRK